MGNKRHILAKNIWSILLAISLVFANVSLVFATGGLGNTPNTSQEAEIVDDSNAEIRAKQEEFLNRITTELGQSKANYKQVLRDMNETKTRLELVGEEKLTLQQYIGNLDGNILTSSEKLDSVTKQIAEKQNQILKIEEEVEIKEVEMEYQKQLLQDYLRLMYEQQNEILAVDEEGNIDAFKLLLTDGSVSDSVSQLAYYDLLTETGVQLAEKLEIAFTDLADKKKELASEGESLAELREEVENEQNQLVLQRDSKARLLATTQGQEAIYNQLLEQTQAQQGEYLLDVKALNDALEFVERKIGQEGDDFDPDDYKSLLDYKTKSLYEFQLESLGQNNEGMNWPVQPSRGVSAYFHDGGYLATFRMQHNAVDIPEYQNTPIHAAADGVVYTAKDNGYGYSYIILAHANGLTTVYGHVSEILVREGDKVIQGSIIGLTGGMPGTKGAGYMTTGPHLHFEVHKNGSAVDPLLYLPLNILSKNFAEGMPEKYYTMWQEQVMAKGEEL